MIIRKVLNENDVFYLEQHFNLKNIKDLKRSIQYLKNIKGEAYYAFPYFFENELTHENLLNIDIYIKRFSNISFWSFSNNPIFSLQIDLLIISDNPLDLLKYYSSNSVLLKKKRFMLISPAVINKDSLEYINQNITFKKVITLYKNDVINELQKTLTTFILTDNSINIRIENSTFVIEHNNKTYSMKTVCYTDVRNRTKIKNSTVTHKTN